MAAEPLSNGAAHKSVPEAYVFPADKRPGSSPSCAGAIPVVDLGGDDPDRIVKQIMDAGREFGFFQVINHGVPEQVITSMVASAEEFFRLPAEEKMALYSTDSKKLPRFHTSLGYEEEKLLYWRDCLKLGIYPTEQFRQNWPDKPASLRAALEAYAPAVRAVALHLLRLTAAGLGLDGGDHFEDGDLTAGPVVVNANHYAACPDPSLTLGLAPHCDPNVVTVHADNGVPGWVDVAPAPGALVVNFGHQMEVVSNGAMRAGEHRVVTDARAARTSVAAFFMPAMGCAVAAAPGTVAAGEKPLFRTFTYQEFMAAYTEVVGDRDAVLARFQNKD
ncbi:unnamed protein product [Urochloa decumbens]|uniref:Fe2OG dioxygenase domain-containing protein n=1 Tax=Urochloa decumbens TaxID=240449 RepID=A0ABC8ZV18_9POAL